MLAYKFLFTDSEGVVRSGSGDHPSWKVGQSRTLRGGVIECCARGFHSCSNFRDALSYAPGTIAAIVDVSGDSDQTVDKSSHRTMKVVSMADVRPQLVQWAKECADRVAKYLDGSYGDDARRNAEWSDRRADAYAAAADAYAAAYAAADAYAAAYAAAADAASAAAYAERKWQTDRLQELIEAALVVEAKSDTATVTDEQTVGGN